MSIFWSLVAALPWLILNADHPLVMRLKSKPFMMVRTCDMEGSSD